MLDWSTGSPSKSLHDVGIRVLSIAAVSGFADPPATRLPSFDTLHRLGSFIT